MDEEEAHRKQMERLKGLTSAATAQYRPPVRNSITPATIFENSEEEKKYKEKIKEGEQFLAQNETLLKDPFGLETGGKRKTQRASIITAVNDPNLSEEAKKAALLLTKGEDEELLFKAQQERLKALERQGESPP